MIRCAIWLCIGLFFGAVFGVEHQRKGEGHRLVIAYMLGREAACRFNF